MQNFVDKTKYYIKYQMSSFDTLCNILSYLQNFAFENNYERIQILTNKKLEFFDSLDYKISFYLMKKSLD